MTAGPALRRPHSLPRARRRELRPGVGIALQLHAKETRRGPPGVLQPAATGRRPTGTSCSRAPRRPPPWLAPANVRAGARRRRIAPIHPERQHVYWRPAIQQAARQPAVNDALRSTGHARGSAGQQ
ncbi:MAG: hypothetical protein MZV70_29310 [Desulfobacterales bacterium]|nr:hypothetical protein [Desulfobacterales bacterium]